MEFEEPPELEVTRDSQYWVGVVQQLKDNPGKAGKTGPYATGVANHIRKGRYAAFTPPNVTDRYTYMQKHWSVTTRVAERRGREHVYITWIGQDCGCGVCLEQH